MAMSNPLLIKAARRVPGLKRLPVATLLDAGEIALLAREHVGRLDPVERRRFVDLIRRGHGHSRNLTASERAELASLVAKANPRLFVGLAADKLSPVPLPRRLVRGKRKRRA